MYELSIELDDGAAAAALRSRLRSAGFDVEELDGRPLVRVDTLARNPERRIEEVLHAVERWLGGGGAASVTVHVDGAAYRLNAPPPR